MLERCSGREGFFTLRDCGDPPLRPCENCGQPFCSRHLAPSTGFARCMDCAALDAHREKPEGEEESYDEEWVSGYRSSYYRDRGYAAVYYSSHRDFTDYDRRSFDRDMTAEGEDDLERSGGFGDS